MKVDLTYLQHLLMFEKLIKRQKGITRKYGINYKYISIICKIFERVKSSRSIAHITKSYSTFSSKYKTGAWLTDFSTVLKSI